jgi:PAS domain S-box-containing protein
MSAEREPALTTVKGSLIRHPLAAAAAGAALAAILALNALAFFRGLESPWLLGTVLVTDMLAIGAGILVAAREVLVADRRTEATQARLGAIVDSAMDAIITVDEAQKIVLFNRAAEQVFRCSRTEALGAPLDRFIPQRFREQHRVHIEQFGRTGVTNRRMGDVTTLWALRADGSGEFPIEASISQATEAGRRFFTVILRDITLRKQAEDALLRQKDELRELSARVLEAREEEKTRIARELHDELGQLLTALKMDLSWIRERLPAGDVAEKAAKMGEMLDQTVSSTRRISADLRPLMLDDLGLADAANWLVDDFSKRAEIHCDIRIEGDGAFAEMHGNLATAVYRALQESLTNIARHSGAKNAWVLLSVKDGRLHFEVEDDGRGIAPGDLAKVRSLGLKGMRERIAYFGGSMEIAPAPRGGTRVRFQVPVRSREDSAA